jgi:hypothetical protein
MTLTPRGVGDGTNRCPADDGLARTQRVRRGALFNAAPHARGHGVRTVTQQKHTPRALTIA